MDQALKDRPQEYLQWSSKFPTKEWQTFPFAPNLDEYIFMLFNLFGNTLEDAEKPLTNLGYDIRKVVREQPL